MDHNTQVQLPPVNQVIMLKLIPPQRHQTGLFITRPFQDSYTFLENQFKRIQNIGTSPFSCPPAYIQVLFQI